MKKHTGEINPKFLYNSVAYLLVCALSIFLMSCEMLYYDEQKHRERELKEIVSKNSDNFECIPALSGLGDMYYHMGKEAQAKKYYEKLIHVYTNVLKMDFHRNGMPGEAAFRLAVMGGVSESAVRWYDMNGNAKSIERAALIRSFDKKNKKELIDYFKILKYCENNRMDRIFEVMCTDFSGSYPDSILKPTVDFMLARYFRYISQEAQKAVKLLRSIVEETPEADFYNAGSFTYFGRKTKKLAPIAQLSIAQLYCDLYNGQCDVEGTVKEFELLIKNFSYEEQMVIDSYMSILAVYVHRGDGKYNAKIKEVCNTVFEKYGDVGYSAFGDCGKTYPQMYFLLADLEERVDVKFAKYVELLKKYPESFYCRCETDACMYYFQRVLAGIDKTFTEPEDAIKKFTLIADDETFEKSIRAAARYYLAEVYLNRLKNPSKAIVEYRKVLNGNKSMEFSEDDSKEVNNAKERIKYLEGLSGK